MSKNASPTDGVQVSVECSSEENYETYSTYISFTFFVLFLTGLSKATIWFGHNAVSHADEKIFETMS